MLLHPFSQLRGDGAVEAFPGRAPLDPARLSRHSLGEGVDVKRVRTKHARKIQERRERDAKMTEETAAR